MGRLRMMIARPDLPLSSATKPYLTSVDLTLADDDGMHVGSDDDHYLSCGASALHAVICARMIAGLTDAPRRILDFGSGAGRVMRWLHAAFPVSQIDACDVRGQDLAFVRSQFGANTWQSGTDIDAMSAPASYDLIWVGSVLTHISAEHASRLLQKLIGWTEPNGLIAISFHGRFAYDRHRNGENYGPLSAPTALQASYRSSGYGYSDYEGQSGYGISFTKMSWTAAEIEKRADVRIVLLSERLWDGHHDVLVLQKASP